MNHIQPSALRSFTHGEGFWKRVSSLVREKVVPYQWELLNDRVPGAAPSHAVENFKIAAGESDAQYQGMVFQDSDLAKWLEAVAYSLMTQKDAALENTADELIALIGRAQQRDGYLNTYYTVKEPGKRWTNLRDCHELYCAGHMMEAAVAYHEATGKTRLLDIMVRMARHIDTQIGPEEGKLHGLPGHPEIELALLKMYEATGDRLMLKLANFFLDRRGQAPDFFEEEHAKRGGTSHFDNRRYGPKYLQNHIPVRQQTTLEGHAVRALYLACGMAEAARTNGDTELLAACKKLFSNMVDHRMYVTGGVGSTFHGEAFTFDDDLPNDTAYNETCAAIALCFFANAMLRQDVDSVYADAMERAMYNNVLSGMSLDGTRFFYVNPLEVWPEASHKDSGKAHALPARPAWYACACCPPNLARFVLSLARYAYHFSADAVYVHQYLDGEWREGERVLKVSTRYPMDGDICLRPSKGRYRLYIRVPGFSRDSFELSLNQNKADVVMEKGYAVLDRDWQEGDEVCLRLHMQPRRVYAHPRLRENAGRVALMRGPLVYCLEEKDNGANLRALSLSRDADIVEVFQADKLNGVVELHAQGSRLRPAQSAQYGDVPPSPVPAPLVFVPYYAWANRGENEMLVWLLDR